ncbi:TetR/AcrR family transcriptional regulator [Mycobacterium sp. OTB74]|uniref:TetR/AcrR family transcriptional regulator n=1 Tax=Mycobacterium sp. OTB74 TaxID=1853452 RepID=UPI002475F9CC|nr:TetR/AcrR family transcriptional regulator [Mycobacterium sp. OTB74]MDH6245321.1 DNA-binding transcriptional regulator YbjK [Mycobacterium sp. OTB74]
MTTSTPRRRDGDQRRRELCDAGIRVLAENGSRGLTHAQVDRYAGVPDGTTSYYYRTRDALLRGVGNRVAEIDSANMLSVTDTPIDARHPFDRLAQLTLDQSDGSGLALNRARHELLLCASRDPDLAEASKLAVRRIGAMCREAIAHLRPSVDAELLDAQTTAVMTFMAGVFIRLAAGESALYDVPGLSATLEAVAGAVGRPTTSDRSAESRTTARSATHR